MCEVWPARTQISMREVLPARTQISMYEVLPAQLRSACAKSYHRGLRSACAKSYQRGLRSVCAKSYQRGLRSACAKSDQRGHRSVCAKSYQRGLRSACAVLPARIQISMRIRSLITVFADQAPSTASRLYKEEWTRTPVILGGCTVWAESLLVTQFIVGVVVLWLIPSACGFPNSLVDQYKYTKIV